MKYKIVKEFHMYSDGSIQFRIHAKNRLFWDPMPYTFNTHNEAELKILDLLTRDSTGLITCQNNIYRFFKLEFPLP